MNLYHVQDSDRPMFVLGSSWQEALDKWRALIREENDMQPNESCEPTGIQLVAEEDELII